MTLFPSFHDAELLIAVTSFSHEGEAGCHNAIRPVLRCRVRFLTRSLLGRRSLRKAAPIQPHEPQ
jgi:hypothetical protein